MREDAQLMALPESEVDLAHSAGEIDLAHLVSLKAQRAGAPDDMNRAYRCAHKFWFDGIRLHSQGSKDTAAPP